jgi:hypothetical protein
MIRTLVRADPSFRWWGKWIGVGMASATLWLGVVTLMAARPSTVDPQAWLLVLGAVPALFVLVAPLNRRAHPAPLAWPVPARALLAAHLIAVGAAVLSILAGTLLTAWLGLRVVDDLVASRSSVVAALAAELPRALVSLAAWLVLATAVLQALDRDLVAIRRNARRLCYSVLVVNAAAAGASIPLGRHPVTVLVVLAVTVGVLVGLVLRCPLTLALAPRALLPPRKGARRRGGQRTAVLDRGRPSRLRGQLAFAVLIHQATGKIRWYLPLTAPILVGFGALLSDFYPAYVGETDLGWLMVAIMAYLLVTISSGYLLRLGVADVWPVARRTVFAWLFGPQLALIAAGYGAGTWLADRYERHAEPLVLASQGEPSGLRVPPRFLAIAWDGSPPVVRSPWGEELRPRPWPVAPPEGPALFNPFATAPTSSSRFVAWQIARAAKAVFGAEIAADRIARRYLTTDSAGRVTTTEGGLSLLADDPTLAVRGRGPRLALLLGAMLALYYAAFGLYLRMFRPGVGERRRKVVYIAILAALLALHLAPFGLAIAGVVDGDAVTALAAVVTRQLGGNGLADSWWVWAGALVVAAGGFGLVARAFERAEFLAPR